MNQPSWESRRSSLSGRSRQGTRQFRRFCRQTESGLLDTSGRPAHAVAPDKDGLCRKEIDHLARALATTSSTTCPPACPPQPHSPTAPLHDEHPPLELDGTFATRLLGHATIGRPLAGERRAQGLSQPYKPNFTGGSVDSSGLSLLLVEARQSPCPQVSLPDAADILICAAQRCPKLLAENLCDFTPQGPLSVPKPPPDPEDTDEFQEAPCPVQSSLRSAQTHSAHRLLPRMEGWFTDANLRHARPSAQLSSSATAARGTLTCVHPSPSLGVNSPQMPGGLGTQGCPQHVTSGGPKPSAGMVASSCPGHVSPSRLPGNWSGPGPPHCRDHPLADPSSSPFPPLPSPLAFGPITHKPQTAVLTATVTTKT